MPTPKQAPANATGLNTPFALLALMAVTSSFAFATWTVVLNNFVIEVGGFSGREIGIQQSIREIPGFMAFAAVLLLLFMREQTLAIFSLLLLGFGVAITGAFPSIAGIYTTTLIMSIGFHYYETVKQSLSLQWLEKHEAPRRLGQLIGVASAAQLLAFALVFIVSRALDLSFARIFAFAGLAAMALAALAWLYFPMLPQKVPQHKKLFLRKRYWLYYALTFMGGARRQIFLVFASFMMVERFGYDVHHIAALYFLNGGLNMVLAPLIGTWIGRVGERRALVLEYIGLIIVFTAYAYVAHPWVAAALYVIDHAFFALALGIKTYFQKIADPADMASSAGVAFTINHIAAVGIPVVFGFIWLVSPTAVFLLGAAMALISLLLALLVPRQPLPGRETVFSTPAPAL